LVDFENLNGLSEDFIKRLKSYNEIFAQLKSIEQCADDEFHQLIMDIDVDKGIIIRTGEEIREEFSQRHFHLFTIE